MAITELLNAERCKIPKMETSTSVRNGRVIFHMTGTVHLPHGGDVDALQSKLRGVQATNSELRVVFDVKRSP